MFAATTPSIKEITPKQYEILTLWQRAFYILKKRVLQK